FPLSLQIPHCGDRLLDIIVANVQSGISAGCRIAHNQCQLRLSFEDLLHLGQVIPDDGTQLLLLFCRKHQSSRVSSSSISCRIRAMSSASSAPPLRTAASTNRRWNSSAPSARVCCM